MFHHDPLHSDRFLDAMAHDALTRWHQLGGRARRVELAAERRELEVLPAPPETAEAQAAAAAAAAPAAAAADGNGGGAPGQPVIAATATPGS